MKDKLYNIYEWIMYHIFTTDYYAWKWSKELDKEYNKGE